MLKSDLINEVETALIPIKPYLEADGGDVRVVDVSDDFIVSLELLGNCGSCPMSAMTMKAGIEEAIKKSLPQVTAVKAINLPEKNELDLNPVGQ